MKRGFHYPSTIDSSCLISYSRESNSQVNFIPIVFGIEVVTYLLLEETYNVV